MLVGTRKLEQTVGTSLMLMKDVWVKFGSIVRPCGSVGCLERWVMLWMMLAQSCLYGEFWKRVVPDPIGQADVVRQNLGLILEVPPGK